MQAQWSVAAGGAVEVVLIDRQLLRLSKAIGCRIECIAGRALITVYGEAAERELRAGQAFTVPNQGLALIETAGGGRIRIAPAPAELAWAALGLRAAAAWRRLSPCPPCGQVP